MDRILHGEARFYQGVLVRCKSYHDDYACSFDGNVMSDDDGIDSSTQVLVVRCVWMLVALSYHARHLILLSPGDPALVAFLGNESLWARLSGGRVCSEQGHMEDLQWTDMCEIPSVCDYRDEREDWYRLFLDLVLFRLVAPPL
jgi:hypothetical protein